MTQWLQATYLVDAQPAEIEARAAAIALEQSVECPLEAIGDQRVLDEIVARVSGITLVGEQRYRVDVRIAAETTGGEPAQLMNMVFGNGSLWEHVQFVDLTLPQELLARFPGPRHGIAGIRALLGAPERALTCAAIKPQGLPIAELTRLAHTFALGGVDIVKDDHGLADQAYSPFARRIPACQAAVSEAVRTTGKRAFYAPNLIGTPRVLRRHAQLARDEGVRIVLVAPMIVGLPAFYDLVAEFPEFVYLSHPSFGGAARIAPPLLFGRLFRLFGADATIFVNYGGRFAYSRDDSAAIAAAARAPWGDVRAVLPVPAGGMSVERVDELLAFYSCDTMLLIGGNLLIARDDLLSRTRAFVEATESFHSRVTVP
ncbi:MAG: ribulose 1,5-bisphosphate carboxylase [Candidatus Eremiobacteraeota bacterium]|nr:ribulose 1,5-bisphosphate carboxylase [Candidatus Eremiobacteraeota bacterium]MBC5802772.1 ribulose 1,5-bisphosphate carboxylase [Candidatus Eremiobacteraeota bacterium]MBC5820891.1 ribulose 1,5-bisphosphate carboxylase [Candidatus Eremiobacteraeota bacterium]